MADNKTGNMSTKQKTRKLFLGMLGPLVTLTLVICTVFALLCGQIVRYYVRAELSRQVEVISADTAELLSPAEINVNLFADIASQTQDSATLGTLISLISKNLDVATSLYYATEQSRFRGGGIP